LKEFGRRKIMIKEIIKIKSEIKKLIQIKEIIKINFLVILIN
jgi:hypothetical protein